MRHNVKYLCPHCGTKQVELEQQIKELKELNEEIDDFLCHIENFIHGEDGEIVTELRAKLNKH